MYLAFSQLSPFSLQALSCLLLKEEDLEFKQTMLESSTITIRLAMLICG